MAKKRNIIKQYINDDGIPVTVYKTYGPRPEEKPRNNRYTIYNMGRVASRNDRRSAYATPDHRYGFSP